MQLTALDRLLRTRAERVRALGGMLRKGGHNVEPSQVTERPAPPGSDQTGQGAPGGGRPNADGTPAQGTVVFDVTALDARSMMSMLNSEDFAARIRTYRERANRPQDGRVA